MVTMAPLHVAGLLLTANRGASLRRTANRGKPSAHSKPERKPPARNFADGRCEPDGSDADGRSSARKRPERKPSAHSKPERKPSAHSKPGRKPSLRGKPPGRSKSSARSSADGSYERGGDGRASGSKSSARRRPEHMPSLRGKPPGAASLRLAAPRMARPSAMAMLRMAGGRCAGVAGRSTNRGAATIAGHRTSLIAQQGNPEHRDTQRDAEQIGAIHSTNLQKIKVP